MSRARSLARLANSNALTVDTNLNVGVGSTTPDAKLDVIGIVSATAFYGDGSNLEGVASAGLGTALGEANGLEVIYYTDNVYSKFASEKLCSYHKSPCIQNRSILDQFNVKKVNGYLILKLIKN